MADPERNYHIFYQLCDGAPADERTAWKLGPASDFFYLNQSQCFDLPGVNNAKEYEVCFASCPDMPHHMPSASFPDMPIVTDSHSLQASLTGA